MSCSSRLSLACLVGLALLPGCTSVNLYRTPLAELREATANTRVGITTLASEANEVKVRNLAVRKAVLAQRFGDNDLAPLVAPEFIAARSQALYLIEEFAKRLLEVVDLKAGEEAATQVSEVGEKAAKFAKQIDPEGPVAQYAGPVGSLAATTLKLYDEHARVKILEEGVTAGLPLAQKVLALIREDFKEGSATDTHETLLEELNSLKTEKISAYDQLLRQHLELPEADRTKPRLVAERAAAIAEIVEVQRSIRAVQKNPVIDLLDALEKALDKLGAIQRFGDSPKSFAEFASAVSEFSQKSVLMINAIRDLREATRD